MRQTALEPGQVALDLPQNLQQHPEEHKIRESQYQGHEVRVREAAGET
jgi:hypothetical protein